MVYSFPQNDYGYSADETGEALAALVQRDVSGNVLKGILGGTATLVSGRSDWQVNIAPFLAVGSVGKSALFGGTSEQLQLAVAEPPITGSRTDRFIWDPVASECSVIAGSPGSPAPAAPADALSLGTGTFAAGNINTSQGVFTPDYPISALQSSSIPFRTTEAMNAWDAPEGTRAHLTANEGMTYRRISGSWVADRRIGTVTAVPGYGISIGAASLITRDQYGMVHARVEIMRSTSSIPSGGPLASIQTGFRPASTMEFAGAVSQGGVAQPCFVQILANGNIVAYNPSPNNRRLTFEVTYKGE